jgi:hypothetical protein
LRELKITIMMWMMINKVMSSMMIIKMMTIIIIQREERGVKVTAAQINNSQINSR